MKAEGGFEKYPDAYRDTYSRVVFGFWIYILTDFVLFGSLFATYAVLNGQTFGGPSAKDLFHLRFTFIQTITLLVSSYTVGLAGAAAHRQEKNKTLLLFMLTFLLGAVFMGMQLTEFNHLIEAGSSWKESAFLSAYFTLVGTHEVHMLFALLWIIVLLIPLWREGITPVSIRRLTCLRMFWQFLNIVWMFIFSFVYLMGVK